MYIAEYICMMQRSCDSKRCALAWLGSTLALLTKIRKLSNITTAVESPVDDNGFGRALTKPSAIGVPKARNPPTRCSAQTATVSPPQEHRVRTALFTIGTNRDGFTIDNCHGDFGLPCRPKSLPHAKTSPPCTLAAPARPNQKKPPGIPEGFSAAISACLTDAAYALTLSSTGAGASLGAAALAPAQRPV